jgi:dolichol-phosphate mannosyltransferase
MQNNSIKSKPRISVIVPAFNEQESINHSVLEIDNVVSKIVDAYELIVVNDGSTDNTLAILSSLMPVCKNLRVLSTSMNCGHMAALEAGMRIASGDYVVSIDADLQDDPKDILRMYEKIQETNFRDEILYDVVQATRKSRESDVFFKRYSAKKYYELIRKITGVPIADHAADFRMVTREVNEILIKLPESKKIFRLLVPALGFNVFNLETTRHKRFAGTTKYPLIKMVNLALNSLIEFSTKPLRIMVGFGLSSTIGMVLFGFFSLLLWLKGSTVPGWTSVVFLILTLNSFIIFSLGLIGIYIGNLHEQVKARPNGYWKELHQDR